MGAAAGAALASDAGESVGIGYSSDGQYFAFEEFGIYDGSGATYSNIYVIDLKSNSWAPGTPIRVDGGEDGPRLSVVRAQAAEKAAPVLKSLKVTQAPQLLAAGPATQPSADRSKLVFDRGYHSQGGAVPVEQDKLWDERFELRTEAVDIQPLPADCDDMGEPVKMLTLHLRLLKAGTESVVYKDTSLPKSRGCVYAYDIDKVFIPADYDDKEAPVALIGVYSRGFEGLDRRFIAIPFNFD